MSLTTCIAAGGSTLATLVLVSAVASAQAPPAAFQLDSSQTRISIAGEGYGIEATEQGPGSLTTTYAGNLLVGLDDLMAPALIEFVAGEATAANNGSWLPNDVLGPAPGENSPGHPGDSASASYGVLIDGGFLLGTAVGAMRNVVASISGPPQPITAGQFAASQTFTLTDGRFDYNLQSPLLGDDAGSEDAAGETGENEATEPGTYHFADGMATVVIPVAATVVLEAVEVHFEGNIVATALLGDVNADGQVNGLDVDPFVDLLLQSQYELLADMNADGKLNGLDVDPFVAAVVGGTQQIPEPSTLLLCTIAVGVVSGWRKWGV